MGILKIAPALVFIVSALIGAVELLEIIIPSTPEISAVLIIAPKFRTSCIWSKIKKNGLSELLKKLSISFKS